MDATNLYYAQFVARILEAADALEKAGMQAVAAKNEQLFHDVHEMRMKCWDIASNLASWRLSATISLKIQRQNHDDLG